MRSLPLRAALIALLAAGIVLTGCAPAPTPSAETPKLRMALIPVIDALPIYVAQQEGFFAKHGVEVELVPVGSAPERDQLIAAGQADGMVNEVLSTLLFNQESIRVQVLRFARAATPETRLFSIVTGKDSGINSVEDLKGVEIGVSDGTVIAYLTDRLLQAEGFAPEEIVTVSVPNIRDRMTLIGSGELKAGMLPEPLTTLTESQGAKVVLDDTAHPELSYSVLTFRKEVVDANPEALKAFMAAVEDAVQAINADPNKYQNILAEQKLAPEGLQFQIPAFVTAGVPSEEQYNDMQAWAMDEGLLTKEVPYDQTVNPAFLP